MAPSTTGFHAGKKKLGRCCWKASASWRTERNTRKNRSSERWQVISETQEMESSEPFMSIERTRHAVSEEWAFRSKQSAQAGARVSAPEDPAMPGLSLLRHPQKLSEVLTPLLKGRFGRDVCVEQTRHSVRRHVPGKRCIVKLEVLMRSAPGRLSSSIASWPNTTREIMGQPSSETARNCGAGDFRPGTSESRSRLLITR